MSNVINVLHVVGRMDYGGTEALLMNLLRNLDTEHFHYDFVEQTPEKCAHDDEIISLGATIYRCPHISLANIKEYRRWWRKFFIEHPEYKIVHGHSRGSAPIYLDEAKKAGRITIAHCHNNSCGKGISGIIRYIWQLPLRKLADYNFACSYDSGVSQFGKNNDFVVIKNGIMTRQYIWNNEIRKKIRKENNICNEFVVGNVARFEEQKNHRFLIYIFYEIYKMVPDAVLMLVGEGSKEQEIHQLATSLNVEHRIIYKGACKNVNELLQAMDVFVLPSNFEGLGIVNIEAQAAGLPVFTSDKVVAPEAKVTDLLTFIPLNKSAKAWAQCIVNGRIDTKKRRDTSQEIIDAGFDIGNTAVYLNSFYYKVLGYGS